MERFIGAIDQGTTSTRFMIFDHGGHEVSRHQIEHQQILPNPGWVEHDPLEIVQNVQLTMTEAIAASGIHPSQLAAIGITNQRETTVVWNPKTGKPLCNALVWQDTRTDEIMQGIERAGGGQLIRNKAGLAPSTYFSAGKIRWILDHVDGVSAAAGRGEAVFGNIDTWVLWNLTGGPHGGIHATDVTNASRTMLMSLETLDWDDELLELFQIPRNMLPSIHPCSDSVSFGTARSAGGPAAEVPITGIVGDQQAATVGQACFHPGEAKNTYGTGNFMLLNTGMEVVPSESGLLSTVCYQFGENRPVYALEGSVAVTGSAVQWLRDQLGIIQSAPEVEDLANTVSDNGGVYFVPAFSGLFAPHWRSNARGAIVGLSRFNTKAHLARATLEAICYQTREVLDAMAQDSGVSLAVLKVDGGASLNDTLMQLQADILGTPVVRPKVIETTALGAAYAAGLAVGYWKDPEDVRHHWQADRTWEPEWDADQRASGYHLWRKAIEKSFDWIES